MDVYEQLFFKMFQLDYPKVYKGYKMYYDFKEYQADIDFYPTDKKLLKMWELLKD